MSKATQEVWQMKSVTPLQRCILLALAEHCDEYRLDTKPVYQAHIADMCECTTRWISTNLSSLEERHYIERTRQGYRIIPNSEREDAEMISPLVSVQDQEDAIDPDTVKKKARGSRSFGERIHGRKTARGPSFDGFTLIWI